MVTLNAPAHAGGAQAMLSSGNTTAGRVPSDVTIPAGASSATFTFITSGVLVSTSVTISDAYNGTTPDGNSWGALVAKVCVGTWTVR
jgi:hypothetical protein